MKVEEECLNVNLFLFLRSVQFLLHMCFDRRNVGLESKCRGQFKDIMKALGVSETVPVASGGVAVNTSVVHCNVCFDIACWEKEYPCNWELQS